MLREALGFGLPGKIKLPVVFAVPWQRFHSCQRT